LGRHGPPSVRLAADVFGKSRVGIMFAWITAAHQLGAATAAFGAGALRTWLGGYQVSFIAAGLLCLAAVGLVLRIGPASGRRTLPLRPAEARRTELSSSSRHPLR
jgi:MFS family permease